MTTIVLKYPHRPSYRKHVNMMDSTLIPGVYLYLIVVSLTIGTSHATPLIYGLPADISIGDNEDTIRLKYFLNVTDTVNVPYTCAVTGITGTPTAANGDEFEFKSDSLTGFELWTTAAGVAAFDAATTDTYIVSVQCTNNNGDVSSAVNNIITVHVEAGENVKFSTSANSITKDASTQTTGTIIYTDAVTTDIAGHSNNIECALERSSISGYFNVTSSLGTCRVHATADLYGIEASTRTVNLVMTATDNIEKITEYKKITLTLTGQNTRPSAPDMPYSDTVSENVVVGTSLYTVSASDPDSGQTHKFTSSCVPTIGDTLITINENTGVIQTIGSLDYETNNAFTCSIYISDGYHTGGPFLYELTVTNQNEQPTFDQQTYYATMTEGAAGVSVATGMTCTDTDVTDTLDYSFLTSTYSPYFSINTAGEVTFAQAYDVDTGGLPSSLTLTVLCKDDNTIDGTTLTGTATLELTVTDVNDNAPTFPVSSYTLFVDQFDIPGSTIGSYVPTDPDSGSNGVYTCTASSTSSYGTYYNIGSDCVVTLASAIDFPYGTTTKYDVSATDQGTPSLTGVGKLDIIYKETSTTTVSTTSTTTAGYDFWAHPENIAMFVLLLLAALALLGLLAWCLAKMCCGAAMGNMCDCNMRNRTRRYPKRRAITPESDRTPPRRRREYTPPPPQKVTVIQERPPVPTYYKPAPPYYQTAGRFPGPGTAGRYPGPGSVLPGGQFPRSPFVPYR